MRIGGGGGGGGEGVRGRGGVGGSRQILSTTSLRFPLVPLRVSTDLLHRKRFFHHLVLVTKYER